MATNDNEMLSSEQREILLKRARASAAAALGGPALTAFIPTDPDLLRAAGCFTTFKRAEVKENEQELRGCLGCTEAEDPIWDAVEKLASETVTQDPRFRSNPVTLDELPSLRIDLSILHPKRKVEDPLDFELGVDGIIVEGQGSYEGRRGIFLPQVATEFNLSKEAFLDACCQSKAGMPPQAWRDPKACIVFAFRAEVFGDAS